MKTRIKSVFLLFSLLALLAIAGNASAAIRTWTGAGADALAGTPGNWSENTAPVAGDSVVFDATSAADCTWDLDIALADWTQTQRSEQTATPRKGVSIKVNVYRGFRILSEKIISCFFAGSADVAR